MVVEMLVLTVLLAVCLACPKEGEEV